MHAAALCSAVRLYKKAKEIETVQLLYIVTALAWGTYVHSAVPIVYCLIHFSKKQLAISAKIPLFAQVDN